MMRRLFVLLALLLTFPLSACTGADDGGTGTLRVTLSGEQGAKVGYPFTVDGETVGFVDGWSLRFDEVVVGVAALRLRAGDGDEAPLDVDHVVASLRVDDPVAWEREGVPARRWDRVGYALRAPSPGARILGGVPEATLARMRARSARRSTSGAARPLPRGARSPSSSTSRMRSSRTAARAGATARLASSSRRARARTSR